MGQKVHPIGFRLGINKKWDSVWFTKKDYVTFLHEDIKIRKYIKKETYNGSVAKITIERTSSKVNINIFSARPGIIIGKRGLEIDKLKKNVQKRMSDRQVNLNVKEIRKPETNAQLVAENITLQLERRIAFRKAMKRCLGSAMKFGAQGIKICCSGRLGGAEIARKEWYRNGRVPLHTIRADIDYGVAEANTTFGIIGVKVWVFHGEILTKDAQYSLESPDKKNERPAVNRRK